MNNSIKMQNLKDRLRLGGNEDQLHDLTFFSPFVKQVEYWTEYYIIIFIDGERIIYQIN